MYGIVHLGFFVDGIPQLKKRRGIKKLPSGSAEMLDVYFKAD